VSVTQKSSRKPELVVIGLSVLVLLLVFIWLTRLQGVEDTPESVGSSNSVGPRGTQALYKWLEKSGFQVLRVGPDDRFPPEADALVMVNPNDDFPVGQAASVRDWVEAGHTLILASGSLRSDLSAESGGRHPMLRELGLDLAFSFGYSSTAQVTQSFFKDPPASEVEMPGIFALEAPISNTLVLASAEGENGKRAPLVAQLYMGNGRVFVLASDYPLSNDGIGKKDNGAFVYNLVQMAGGTTVAFDEAHHGAPGEGGDMIALLTRNQWGWAIIYAALVAGIYVVWSARRLGAPLPEQKPDQRRPTSDYVTAVAGLFRRARKPGYAAERYLRYFKRTLSKHAELDPYLTDAGFVQALYERGRHAFNPDEMLRAVERLRQLEGVGEGRAASESVEMDTLSAIREAERLRKEALGIREHEA
jgi:hypothetical protein